LEHALEVFLSALLPLGISAWVALGCTWVLIFDLTVRYTARQQKRTGFFGWLSTVKWGPLLMIIFMFGPGIFGGGLWLYDFAYPSADGGSGSTVRSTEYYYDQIEGFYRQHNPQKIAEIPKLMEKYKGREGVSRSSCFGSMQCLFADFR
jgi:hypothetical protein